MKLTLSLKVTIEGREHAVLVGPATQVAFERQFDASFLDLLDEDDMRLERFFWVAWHASQRAKAVPRGMEFDDFLDVVENVEPVGLDEDEDEDPTSEAQ